MKTVFFTLLSLFILFSSASAQKFTHQDTLRGKLLPERSCYDVVFYDLSLRVIPNDKYIKGSNIIHYKVLTDFDRIQIDLFDNMKIDKITHNGKELTYKRDGNAVFVQFKDTQKKGKVDFITISYQGKPREAVNAPWDGGFSWSKDTKGNTWIGVSCEGLGASCWWPNKDHLSEEPDSMRISCEVPSDLICISNGNLRKETKLDDKYTRYDWFVSYPINNYNVTLNIGKYAHWSDIYTAQDGEKLDLDYYVLDYNVEKAKKHFEQVKPMLACYEKLFGKYPFWKDGFALVETPYLGMEHQGAVAYGNEYMQGYKGSDLTGTGIGLLFDYLIIHETGHEYWGNSVSCKDHAEMWIHEGFCTYSEALYIECLYGTEKAEKYINGYRRIIGNGEAMIAPYDVNSEATGDIYPKGANFLHTLRSVVDNDKLWFEIIYGIANEFKIKNTDTEEILAYVNKKSGKDFTFIFKQYLRFPAIPDLMYKIKKDGEKTVLEYQWKADVKEFDMPLKIKVGERYETITPSTKEKKEIVLAENPVFLKEKYYVKFTEMK